MRKDVQKDRCNGNHILFRPNLHAPEQIPYIVKDRPIHLRKLLAGHQATIQGAGRIPIRTIGGKME
jgi:hypothetical protein